MVRNLFFGGSEVEGGSMVIMGENDGLVSMQPLFGEGLVVVPSGLRRLSVAGSGIVCWDSVLVVGWMMSGAMFCEWSTD